MSIQKQEKLKSLIARIPPGFLVDSGWLRGREISPQLAATYVHSGWLERLLQGLYRRPFTHGYTPDATLDWKIPVLSAQWIMGYKFHVAGATAMEQHGYGHYLRLSGSGALYVHGEVPTWLARLELNAKVVHRQGLLFRNEARGLENFSPADGAGHSPVEGAILWPLRLSSPERAILETLDEVPRHESFHLVDTMFQSLTTLRPNLMTQLLRDCHSIKTKRLFFAFADRYAHAWRKHIDQSHIDLGSGDRMLVEGGKLHPIYRITMPAEFVGNGPSDGA